jgi:glutathione S-transferase
MKIYYGPLSPPSRLVVGVAKWLEIDFELVVVDLSKQEQLGEEYAKLNPNKKVPLLVDGDFVLSESTAIIRYLAATAGEKGQAIFP